jgi:hypothetical protein
MAAIMLIMLQLVFICSFPCSGVCRVATSQAAYTPFQTNVNQTMALMADSGSSRRFSA